MVRLSKPKIHKARSNAADVHDAGDVFMSGDSSVAPLLDLRRRFKAVMDVLDSMIRNGVLLARSVEPLFNGIGYSELGLFILLLWRIFVQFTVVVLVSFFVLRVIFTISSVTLSIGLSFIVGMSLFGGGNWLRADLFIHPCKWLRLDIVPCSFSSV